MSSPFDSLAQRYDRWYDTEKGEAIFREEVACLRMLCPACRGHWLEVGVGTGRFADTLGIAEGIDPAAKMREYAARRGIRVRPGTAGAPPHPDGAFDGVLMALTLCFVEDLGRAFRGCFRILRGGGALLLGIIPADSSWGRHYALKGDEGHPIYASAHFHTIREVARSAEETGFVLRDTAGALFWNPDGAPPPEPRIERGTVRGAGFAALRFVKPRAGASRKRTEARTLTDA
ncbi:MAG: class I SAM-dependent methyltransferase [Planctomycetota bacterium]